MADGNYQAGMRLRSQSHQEALQASITLDEGSVDNLQPEDWRAKFAEAEHWYEELIHQKYLAVHRLEEQNQSIAHDRDAYKHDRTGVSFHKFQEL